MELCLTHASCSRNLACAGYHGNKGVRHLLNRKSSFVPLSQLRIPLVFRKRRSSSHSKTMIEVCAPGGPSTSALRNTADAD